MDDTVEAIHELGHRKFVGGDGPYWDVVADLQFDFLCARRLKSSDTFIDIGCGSLRGGRRFIDYLEVGKYHGIDKYIELLIYAVNAELGLKVYRRKMPRFVVSDRFEFARFGTKFTFGIAQALFTHLTGEDIGICLASLSLAAAPGCRVFATFFEVAVPRGNPRRSLNHVGFGYTRGEMETFGSATGWIPKYIGEWGHPRGQNIIEYVKPGGT